MEMENLLIRLKMDYLGDALESLCEEATKKALNYREFLQQAFVNATLD
ncbi:hypothetical protein [Candidatus Regiella endosymbiont of Tuberolachnus salignus]